MATIVVEEWCNRSLYLWSSFSGSPGTNNDLNVLAGSPLIKSILRGDFKFEVGKQFQFTENGPTRNKLYFLGGGIYPNWPLFAKPIHEPTNDSEKMYTNREESIKKEKEKCFSVLQARFEILRRENRRWDKKEVVMISEVCAILHNIIKRMVQPGELVCEDGGDIIQDHYHE